MISAVPLAAWSPYETPDTVLLSLILIITGVALVLLGRKMTREIRLPKMRKVIGVIVVVIWIFSILAFLRISRDIARYTRSAGNLGPIFPITIATAVCTFAFVAYVSRSDGRLASLRNGFLGFIAGPMVFEFPFILIIIPRVSAPLIPALIFFIPLFTIIFTTLSMLLFSPRVAITKYSIYFYAGMIFVFAAWALEGYSYPSNPVSFTLNAISKVLGFASVAAMFLTEPSKEIVPPDASKQLREGKQEYGTGPSHRSLSS